MGRFLKENWIWIAVPVVVVLVGLVLVLLFSEGGGSSPFVYNL